MHDAGRVRRYKAGDNRPGDPQRLCRRHPALLPDQRGEIGAVHVRHRDVFDAADLAEIVDADDVTVRDLPGEQQLALEAALDIGGGHRIGHHLGANHFDGDGHRQFLVPRLIHRTHAAHAEEPDDVIARAEHLADAERAMIGGTPSREAGVGSGVAAESVRRGVGSGNAGGCIAGRIDGRPFGRDERRVCVRFEGGRVLILRGNNRRGVGAAHDGRRVNAIRAAPPDR